LDKRINLILICFLLIVGNPGFFNFEVSEASADDTLVNTFTTNWQKSPAIAMGPNGNFVITWESRSQIDNYYDIYAQMYDSSGSPIGSEFRVNTYTKIDQIESSIAMNVVGNFIITWTSCGLAQDSCDIYAQMYDSSGSPIGSEFRVNTYTNFDQDQPSIAMDSFGNFVITWQSGFVDGDNYGISAKRFNSSGSPIGSEFIVNTSTALNQVRPSIAMAQNGNFVITWSGWDSDDDSSGISAQMYDSFGNAIGSEFTSNTYETDAQFEPVVAMDVFGNFVITWKSYGQDGNLYGIFAQRFNSSGIAVGSEFGVNTYTNGNQEQPAIAMDVFGNFVITWDSYGQDGDEEGVFMKSYSLTDRTDVVPLYDASGHWKIELTNTWVNPGNADCKAVEGAGDGLVEVSQYDINVIINGGESIYGGLFTDNILELFLTSPSEGGTLHEDLEIILTSEDAGYGTHSWNWFLDEYSCNGGGDITFSRVEQDDQPSGGGSGGGGGIFGDILKSSVIGYHLDAYGEENVKIYMPVTQGFKALKGVQEYIRSLAPDIAVFVRECFDYLEQKADSNREGFLYKIGTWLFPKLGYIAEESLKLLGKEKYIESAYSDTTISIDEFNELKKQGLAIAPKVVRDDEDSKQEYSLTNLVLEF